MSRSSPLWMVGSLLSNRPLETMASGNWVWSSLWPARRARLEWRAVNCSRCSSVAQRRRRRSLAVAGTRSGFARRHQLRRISGRFGFGNGVSGRDEGDGKAVFHFRVHRRAHDDLGALAIASDLFHHAVDLGHRQILSAHEAHEDGVGFGKSAAFIQAADGRGVFPRPRASVRDRWPRQTQTRSRNGGRARGRTGRQNESG